MTDGRDPAEERLEADLAAALRGAAGEALPSPAFREALRARFVGGEAVPPPASAAPAPLRAVPRWIAYPAAAAVLLLAFALSGALGPRAEPEAPIPPPARLTPEEAAWTAAERRIARAEPLAGRTWQRRLVEGRPWLLPAEAAFADAGKLRTLGRWAGEAEAALRDILPSAAAREALPVVAVVAPGRRDFEAMVAPEVDPVPVEGSTIAFALRRERVLLISPEALEPGGPPCEAMDVFHESAHAWLHARTRGHAPLPLWLEEGIAGIVAERGADSREWCRKLLALRKEGLDPFTPARILDLRVYGDAARYVAPLAPCEEWPYSLLVLFHAHAQALALFLTDAPGEPDRREAFDRWLASTLDGKDAPAAEAAKALGFDSPAALFEARDRWLGK